MELGVKLTCQASVDFRERRTTLTVDPDAWHSLTYVYSASLVTGKVEYRAIEVFAVFVHIVISERCIGTDEN
jgi:hypothetical protein